MENASKALIIAGAILLSILLISLGIMIFNQAESAIDGSGMSDAQLHAFNQKFLKYDGKIKGSTVRSMVQEVMANNNSEEASDETRVSINVNNGDKKIESTNVDAEKTVTLDAAADSSPVYKSEFKNTKTYTVSFVYDNARIAIIQVK